MPANKRKHHPLASGHTRCYVEWLRLKRNPGYRKASDKIRRLEAKYQQVLSRGLQKARITTTDSAARLTFSKPAARRSTRLVRRAALAVSRMEEEVCKQFGLTSWAHPDDRSITFANVDAVVKSSFPVYAIGRSRTVTVGGKQIGTKATEDGWLTLKVNLLRPLEDTERVLASVLRSHRHAFQIPNRRLRAISDLKALEAWDCYSETPQFSSVAQKLNRRPSTVKGQYVRGHVLVLGTKPSGSMKRRRLASIGEDPAGEFQSHLASCSRCQKADSADDFCSKWVAFADQDQVSLREQLKPPIK